MDTTVEEARRQIARIEHELSLPCSSERRDIGEHYLAHYRDIVEGAPPLPPEPQF